MRILTLNCHGLPFTRHRQRFIEIKKTIASLEPDLVLLQEVFFTLDIKLILPVGYTAEYISGLGKINGGLVTLLKKPLLAKTTFISYESQSRTIKQLSDRLIRKGMLVTTLMDPSLSIVNTHMVCAYNHTASSHDSVLGDQVTQLIAQAAKYPRVIVGGDFNFGRQSPYYLKINTLLDDISDTEEFSFPKWRQKLDYVWTKGFRETDHKTVILKESLSGTILSDHYSLVTEIGAART